MYKLLIFFLLPSFCFGQMKVFVSKKRENADIIIYKTNFFVEADLVIKKTWDHHDMNKPYHWYLVSNYTYANPDWIIYYTNNIKEATHVVYFTNKETLLGSYSACEPIEKIYIKKNEKTF
jgi:hypothetical protein